MYLIDDAGYGFPVDFPLTITKNPASDNFALMALKESPSPCNFEAKLTASGGAGFRPSHLPLVVFFLSRPDFNLLTNGKR